MSWTYYFDIAIEKSRQLNDGALESIILVNLPDLFRREYSTCKQPKEELLLCNVSYLYKAIGSPKTLSIGSTPKPGASGAIVLPP